MRSFNLTSDNTLVFYLFFFFFNLIVCIILLQKFKNKKNENMSLFEDRRDETMVFHCICSERRSLDWWVSCEA